MSEPQTLLDWLGVSGLLAILGGVASHVRLGSRVNTLEERAKQDTSQENQIAIARLEERISAMNSDIQDIKRAVVK